MADNEKIVIRVEKGGDRDLAGSLSARISAPIQDKDGNGLTVLFDSKGVSLTGYGLTYQGDFAGMMHRITNGRLEHEMLVRAVKTDETGKTLKAVDATAGMGEDAFLIAAYGYEVILCEQNPVIAVLLKDALRRAKRDPYLKNIAGRMTVKCTDSVEYLSKNLDKIDVVYLDPMFPARQKSGLINKKLQLIQKLEPPCSAEKELFEAAILSKAERIIVKRPLKSQNLAGKTPNYMLKGKAIRYDCYVQGK